MTDDELFTAIGNYAAEHGVMPHRISGLIDLFRMKLTDEQLVARATATALERGCPEEHLKNPSITDAVRVRFGGDASIADAEVWLDRNGNGCMMSFSPKQPPNDQAT